MASLVDLVKDLFGGWTSFEWDIDQMSFVTKRVSLHGSEPGHESHVRAALFQQTNQSFAKAQMQQYRRRTEPIVACVGRKPSFDQSQRFFHRL